MKYTIKQFQHLKFHVPVCNQALEKYFKSRILKTLLSYYLMKFFIIHYQKTFQNELLIYSLLFLF